MLKIVFFVTATAVKWRIKALAKWHKTGSLGAEPPADFNGFHVKKNAHLSTLFIEKGRTVLAASAVSKRQYKNILVGLPKSLGIFKSRSLAKINERRMQLY